MELPLKTPPPELTARRRAYAALAAAYDRDPAQSLYLDQIRRDTAAGHAWLAKQKAMGTSDYDIRVLDLVRGTP